MCDSLKLINNNNIYSLLSYIEKKCDCNYCSFKKKKLLAIIKIVTFLKEKLNKNTNIHLSFRNKKTKNYCITNISRDILVNL